MRLLLIVIAASVATTAHALTDSERWRLAQQLGTVIGSEAACGLAFDQAAIAAFIEARVPADDMAFPNDLRLATDVAASEAKDMSQSARTAHCTQIARIAKAYGFVK